MDNAIAVLNLTVSESEPADRATLVELAAWHGCRITDVLTIDAETYMPTTLIAYTAHTARAAVILAPSLAHFGTAVKALRSACTLVVPQTAIPRIPG
ncbi:hypothetical protein [Nocardia shimofusensis]|uniref:hypothetical protein n=1 Tax=Nocardia shimofusensis TaxID=228596 RepID=UPI0008326748|nr:hypothetical protein [Nocardia shimofusensis]